ncbi:9157_t:CDS:2 [Gigaspora rosea]|nr:9157_t:CDS:2 [Gigaspora rosea]
MQTGAKVLEFGCSSGVWSIEVAAEYPNSKFYAVDSTMQNSTDKNVTFIGCDIYQTLPFPDNEFDYVFSRNKTDLFSKNNFQGFLFEIIRVLKPEGWLEIVHSLRTDDYTGQASARLNAAITSWHKERGIDFDIIRNLEDYFKMSGKLEFISSQIIKIPIGGDNFGEFSYEVALYYIKLMKEILVPFMGISSEEYDQLSKENEDEMKKKRGELYGRQKRVFARKK